MKHGKDLRDPKGQPIEPTAPKELTALMFVLVEVAPGAFKMRLVWNDDLIRDFFQCSRDHRRIAKRREMGENRS
jgi:hypothetical protein